MLSKSPSVLPKGLQLLLHQLLIAQAEPMSQAIDRPLRLSRPTMALCSGDGSLQLDSATTAILLKQVPDQLAQAITLLGNPHSRADLAARLPNLERDWIDWLCDQLFNFGLVTEEPLPTPPVVQLCGRGALAARMATALTQAGVPVRRGWVEPIDCHADLVVLADRYAEPDRAQTDQLCAAQVPYLVVRLEPAKAVVGPLVMAGVTSCLRCDDLARCRLDRSWPRTLAQLCAHPIAADPTLLAWAVATATIQIRGWADTGQAEVMGRCLELGLSDYRLRSRSWPPHPGCTCGSAKLEPLGRLDR